VQARALLLLLGRDEDRGILGALCMSKLMCVHVCVHVLGRTRRWGGEKKGEEALRILRGWSNASFYSQYIGDDANGPAVHSLAVGFLGQHLWSCSKPMAESGLRAREEGYGVGAEGQQEA
jgi:hypothetical protein